MPRHKAAEIVTTSIGKWSSIASILCGVELTVSAAGSNAGERNGIAFGSSIWEGGASRWGVMAPWQVNSFKKSQRVLSAD